jgi:hypothetical protein
MMWVAHNVDAHAGDGGPEDDTFLDATTRDFVSQLVEDVRGGAPGGPGNAPALRGVPAVDVSPHPLWRSSRSSTRRA